MPEIATVPLNGLVALHLLARDLLAMTQGCSIRTLDEGKEFTASWDLPDLRNHMEDLKKNCPQALAVVCRLVARSVYLASDLPMSVLEVENVVEAPPLAMVVKEMDILDELTAVCEGKGEDAASLLDEPVPLCLKYWNEWNDGHVMSALKEFQSYWLEVREVYLAPPNPLWPLLRIRRWPVAWPRALLLPRAGDNQSLGQHGPEGPRGSHYLTRSVAGNRGYILYMWNTNTNELKTRPIHYQRAILLHL